MDQDSILQELSSKGSIIIDRLKEELLSIRTGKPNPGLVEDLIVNAYGGTAKLRLKELASITSEPPQSLVISPFDQSVIRDIETAILASNLNITPLTQGTLIRVSFPPLTEDQRTQMVKVVSGKVEEFKDDLRAARDDARKRIRSLFDQKLISEDEKTKAFEVIDKTTKDLGESIESIKVRKQADLMTV